MPVAPNDLTAPLAWRGIIVRRETSGKHAQARVVHVPLFLTDDHVGTWLRLPVPVA
jgi:hypothetical protein